ncbi:hypothetical protein PWT90_00236 [Aphanocladium album]|nr:hypothetical protein PWT90_00236 [Aphanocladium album]
MCKSRILCRFRYAKKQMPSSPKNPLDKVVDRARQSLLQLREGVQVPKMERYRRHAASMEAQVVQFLDKSAKLLQVISNWQQHKVDSELCAVIDGLFDFAATDKWRDVVDLIPDSLMEPSMRKSFSNMIRKGARYRHAARILYRSAKKLAVTRRMRAIPVHLPESAFRRCQVSSTDASLDKTWNRVIIQKKNNLRHICQILKIDVLAADVAFDSQKRKTLTQGKFHAEIQLLHQILANPSPYPPRIVCASKDACFLCHVLIQAHAKIFVPRCHGKLYPGWRLPLGPEFRALQISLNHTLEQRIRDCVTTLVQNKRSQCYPDPCESSCSTAILSDTTAVPSEADAAGIKAVAGEDSEATSYESTPIAWPITPPIVLPSPLKSSSSSSTIRSMSHYDNPRPIHPEQPMQAELSIRQSYALAQGEVVASSLAINEASEVYTAAPLQVQLEYTKTERSILNESAPRLRYRIQQLTTREAHELRESSYIPVVDVTSLGRAVERTYQLYELTDLYLGAGDCIFRLILEPANSGR